jgi:hypothetical protein
MHKPMTDEYLVTCDMSGFVCKRSECVVQWNGLLVRRDFAELERHPQDHIPTVKEAPFTGIGRSEPRGLPLDPLLTEDDMI